MKPPSAVVMNMFYTGLGIARSLGENGIPVIGLSAQRRFYGNHTRYAKVLRAPDSKTEPEALLRFLLQLGRAAGERRVIFPTRDADLIFLDRFRGELSEFFAIAAPYGSVLDTCLNKWKTYEAALRAGIPTPRCWMIETAEQLEAAAAEARYPCVLKPVVAQDWRAGANWETVGGRKAIPIRTPEEMRAEYALAARARSRALAQELVTGGDERLSVVACYFDRNSKWASGFNTHKLLQIPEGFGTGCIVELEERTELWAPTQRLLESIGFSGIAEVEYKWDAERQEYLLIEINPRPWDQHRLGKVCGTDLALLAYCEHAGVAAPAPRKRRQSVKWVAEDAFLLNALSLLWKGDPKLRTMFRLARGKKIYGIWSARDPLPFLVYLATSCIPTLAAGAARVVGATLRRFRRPAAPQPQPCSLRVLEKGRSDG